MRSWWIGLDSDNSFRSSLRWNVAEGESVREGGAALAELKVCVGSAEKPPEESLL